MQGFVSTAVGELIDVASRMTGAEATQLHRSSEILLHHPPPFASTMGGRSDLNWNGSPLQLLASIRRGGVRHRLIGDPAFFLPTPLTRFRGSVDALRRTLDAGRADDMWDVCWKTLVLTLPRGEAALGKYAHGMLRLAVALEGPGGCVYVGSEHEPTIAWRRAHEWLAELLPEPSEALGHVSRLASCSQLLGVGLEGRAAHEGRAKLYWRLSRPVALADFGSPLFESPPILGFLAALMREREIPLHGLTFSAGFDLRTGGLRDVKVDVCLKSAKLDGRRALTRLRPVADVAGLAVPFDATCRHALERRSVDVGCIGIGTDRHGEPRMNLYLFQSAAADPGAAAPHISRPLE